MSKTVRVSCRVSWQVTHYLDWLVRGGLHGNTRSQVAERLICDAIARAIPADDMGLAARGLCPFCRSVGGGHGIDCPTVPEEMKQSNPAPPPDSGGLQKKGF